MPLHWCFWLGSPGREEAQEGGSPIPGSTKVQFPHLLTCLPSRAEQGPLPSSPGREYASPPPKQLPTLFLLLRVPPNPRLSFLQTLLLIGLPAGEKQAGPPHHPVPQLCLSKPNQAAGAEIGTPTPPSPPLSSQLQDVASLLSQRCDISGRGKVTAPRATTGTATGEREKMVALFLIPP